jgi:hypothetical protein
MLMADVDAVVQAVCRLPIDHSLGTLSAVDLVEGSGYLRLRSQITVERLAGCLAGHTDWVDAWFGWSADNRSTPAWWIGGIGNDRYEVGYSERPPVADPAPLVFRGKVVACAEYVHRELEQIAEIAERPVPQELRLWRELRRQETRRGRRLPSRDLRQP